MMAATPLPLASLAGLLVGLWLTVPLVAGAAVLAGCPVVCRCAKALVTAWRACGISRDEVGNATING
jgi:hypothetical protein